ncbi:MULTISPECIES: DMT family transporter [unclassified Luteococcus]|uniref:DMT family transporter n=1 Tax=unclassified Luteococcus TaxID=2639923 RepID=UPI00313A8E84
MDPWLALLLAGVFEVGFTTCLKLEQRNKNWGWGFLVCAVISFGFLEEAIRTIPLGTAYAVWTGIGAVGTVAVGHIFFGDRLRPAALVLVGVVVALIAALKVVS